MKKFLEMLTEEMQQAFTAAGYDGSLGKVMLSNRPDLCEYQCNGAMAGAKLYKKAPIMIANDVAEQLKDSKVFSEVLVSCGMFAGHSCSVTVWMKGCPAAKGEFGRGLP